MLNGTSLRTFISILLLKWDVTADVDIDIEWSISSLDADIDIEWNVSSLDVDINIELDVSSLDLSLIHI